MTVSSLLLVAALATGDVRYIQTVPPGPASAAVVVPDILPLLHTGQFVGEPDEIFDRLEKLLKSHGSDLSRLVRIHFAGVDNDAVQAGLKRLARAFPGDAKPAVTTFVGQLPGGKAKLAVDAVATLPEDPKLEAAKVTSEASVLPRGSRVWISGQAEVGDNTMSQATRLTLESLRRTLHHLKLKDGSIVQLRVFLQPMSEVEEARKEIERFFGSLPVPPVVFLEWKNKQPIEIELVAYAGRERGGWPVEYLSTPELKPSPVFSRMTRVNYGPLIFLSGLHPQATGAEAEVEDVLKQLDKTLERAGSDLRHLVKATYFVTDAETTTKMREIRPKFYDPEKPPAASLAMAAGTGHGSKRVTLDMIAAPAIDNPKTLNLYGPATYGHGLTQQEAMDGWVSLFDGETDFGWKNAIVKDGQLLEGTTTCGFRDCEIVYELQTTKQEKVQYGPVAAGFQVTKGHPIRSIKMRPLTLTPLFNGKDLSGWKAIHHPKLPEKSRATWEVQNGILRTVGGPGALEYQTEMFGDAIFELEIRSRLRYTNGGVFLRSIPGDFMNGYEAQIHTRCLNDDPKRPVVWATGAIDDRQNARLLVSRDGEPFKMTIITQGPRIATWVNGHQTVDFVDTREKHVNPRQGLRLEAGVLQLQAHDPATDIEFRAIHAKGW